MGVCTSAGRSRWWPSPSRPSGRLWAAVQSVDVFSNRGHVPPEGLEPPTVSLGRNCSSIELQRLASTSLVGGEVSLWQMRLRAPGTNRRIQCSRCTSVHLPRALSAKMLGSRHRQWSESAPSREAPHTPAKRWCERCLRPVTGGARCHPLGQGARSRARPSAGEVKLSSDGAQRPRHAAPAHHLAVSSGWLGGHACSGRSC